MENKRGESTFLDHYGQLFTDRKDTLESLSSYVVADGYFAKKPFVDTILNNTGLQLISKLRKDARLKYLYRAANPQGIKTKKKGRPKQYDGDVNLNQVDDKHFSSCYEDEEVCMHQAVVWSVSLKQKINLAYVQF